MPLDVFFLLNTIQIYSIRTRFQSSVDSISKKTSTDSMCIDRTSINLNKVNWDRYSREIENKLSKRRLPTDCQKGEKLLRAIILKAASHHIPSGRHRINTEPVPTEILEKMRARDDLRSRDPTSPALPEMNDEITRTTNEHKRQKWRRWITRQILQNCGELSRQ